MPTRWRFFLLFAALAEGTSNAGEIAGLRPQLPPFLERDLEVVFVNDFLGRGGSIDDFRTQQLIVSAMFSEKWLALIDHSIMTLTDAATPGRVDQLSASLGYQFKDTSSDRLVSKLVAGIGVRSAGDFAGQRMQNGFHRLVGNNVDILPYTNTSRTDATIWFDTDYYRRFGETDKSGWRSGYWLRASSLLSSGGQWDSSAGLFAHTGKPGMDFWLGIRRDWRSGYDDLVLRETAEAEDDLAIVLGARFGALVIETVQQLNNDASYGQIRLVSTGVSTARRDGEAVRWGLEAGFLLPNVELRLAGRYRAQILTNSWKESIVIGLSYGEPQQKDNANVFVRSQQIDVGVDLERPLSEQHNWISLYATIGAGWRTEKLIGVDDLEGESSESDSGVVLLAGTGLRFDAARLGQHWNYRITLGLSGRLPIDGVDLQIADQLIGTQNPALDLMLGMTFDF